MWPVVDRRAGRGLVKKFTSPAFFCFHTVNAWEEGSSSSDAVDIVCELAEFKSMDVLHRFYYENLVSDESNVATFHACHPRYADDLSLTRYKLESVPLSGGRDKKACSATLAMRIPSPAAGDLPVINPHYALRPHRYVWSVLDRGHASTDGLGKTDTRTQACVVWEQQGRMPGEPIFVPAPGAEAEDEGVVLSVVLDGRLGASYLLCLDARTMREMGGAEVGRAVGMGFHGLHVPAEV